MAINSSSGICWMTKNRRRLKLLSGVVLSLLFVISAFPQSYKPAHPWQSDSLITGHSGILRFEFPATHRPYIQTLRITLNGSLLKERLDYILEDEKTLYFFNALNHNDILTISYRRFPSDFKQKYTLFTPDTLTAPADTTVIDSGLISMRRVKFENPFANVQSGMITSGSIMRGIQIGTNSDFALNSGLNLELSGKLTDNLEIVAALNDEATPIQPEGNTQTLKEVDKVFVKFRSPYVAGTVGDFNLQYQNSQFGNLQRKLQGLTVLGKYKSKFAGATIATTRGFFHHVSFIGQEGNQGPYQLTGKNGERNIIVLAGTERIYINGRLMTRGESNDYIIEYGNGQVTFSNRRLITSESRIEIDFEYFPAVQKYSRNVYGGIVGGSFFNDKLKVDMRYFRESDDPGQVLEDGDALNEEEKEILRQAGNDPFNAYVSGEIFRSDTTGNYAKIDTVIDNEPYAYFKYIGQNAAMYDVRFTYVGPANGDYSRDRLGVYRWIGIKKGNYLPIRLLPLPIKHDLANVQVTWNPHQSVSIKGEMATSFLDQNTFSPIDNENNRGQAYTVEAEVKQVPINVSSIDFGKITLNFNTRYLDKNFRSVDRVFQPDFRRYWNVLQEAEETNEEKSFQFRGIYQPISYLQFAGNAGQLTRGDLSSARRMGQMDFDRQEWFQIMARYEYVGSEVRDVNVHNDWWRYNVTLLKQIWKLKPKVNYTSELRKNKSSDRITGFQFDDVAIGLGIFDWKSISGSIRYNRRDDAIYDPGAPGVLVPQSATDTRQVEFTIQNYANTTATIRFVSRSKVFDQAFKNIKNDSLKQEIVDPAFQDTIWQDRTTNLAELNLSHDSWKKALNLSVKYRISTEQTALREKVYIDVGENRGNYRYDEALDEYVPDADGNYVLFIVQSGQFEPVTNFQSSFRISIDPSRYWRKPTRQLQKVLSNLSSETLLRIEEETKERNLWSIYLMNLSRFQGDSTLRGTIQLNQDIFIMRRNRDLSFRLRYRLNTSRFNQYLDADENEDRRTDEFGVRVNWRIFSKLRSQTELRRKDVFRDNKSSASRNRNILGWFANQRFSWRPNSKWEFGIESEYGNENNRTTTYPIKLWFAVVKGRISYAFPGKGRITGEYNYQTVQPTDNPLDLPIPYEMALGRKEGNSKDWQLRGEYTVAKNILFTLSYRGRDEAGFERIIHSGQMEIRAFF